MTERTGAAPPVAYTVEEVERYVAAVASQRVELELAIAHAKARIARAVPIEDRLAALERQVAQLLAERAGVAHTATLAAHRNGSDPAAPGPSADEGSRP